MDTVDFRSGRFFYQAFIAGEGSGWFFNAREGAYGPFSTKLQAQFELELFIQRCIDENLTGGRNSERTDEAVEEVIAASPPQADTSLGYLGKLRAAVRNRASRYIRGMNTSV